MIKLIKEIITCTVIFSLLNCSILESTYAAGKKTNKVSKNRSSVDELVLPADVKDVKLNQGGAIYYSPTTKNKVLIPVYFWGEIKKSGLHYVPIGTSFIKGLTLAGGPMGSANIGTIRLFRSKGGEAKIYDFDLEDNSKEIFNNQFVLKPSDVIRVERDYFYQNRAYFTSLVGIAVTILSGVMTYKTIKDN